MTRVLTFLLLVAITAKAEPLVVHEWGTFTVLQDENGETIPGINIDDEPLPGFVHRVGNLIRSSSAPPMSSKGPVARCHPDVKMRLETPVIYFYPPAGEEMTVDVEVAFPGGWISEYYPDAMAVAPGLEAGRIPKSETGTIAWKGLKIGGRANGPKTDFPVWLVPRKVDAASVLTPAGEQERYLFYRGVANLEAPVKVRREGGSLRLEGHTRAAWLADFRSDGTAAFRRAGADMPADFSDYDRQNVTLLKEEMRSELIAEGLFPKEAEAMLKTWEASYFQSQGLRLFYIVPREWTDEHLPLKISGDARITRAMVGRIEMVTPAQRKTLERLVNMESIDRTNLPGGYYLLGRFADAILAGEHRRQPTEGTRRWMSTLMIGAVQ